MLLFAELLVKLLAYFSGFMYNIMKAIMRGCLSFW